MTEGKGSRRLTTVIVVVFGLLLAEALLVAFVFVSPSASERLGGVAASIQRIWDGTETDPGMRTDVASAFHRGYQYWIVPLWSSPDAPPGEPGFSECVECHPDYADKRKFTVFLNHPLHAQYGVECATCHRQNVHPNPPRPQEATCAECHRQVDQENGCGFCHPPASLPHFYLLGASREGVVECGTCHPRGRFDTHPTEPLVHPGNLDGTEPGTCLRCHEVPSCRGCHGEPHPSNWQSEHGGQLFAGGAAVCYACHTQTWCADRCHAVTSTVPLVPRPIPQAGVRP